MTDFYFLDENGDFVRIKRLSARTHAALQDLLGRYGSPLESMAGALRRAAGPKHGGETMDGKSEGAAAAEIRRVQAGQGMDMGSAPARGVRIPQVGESVQYYARADQAGSARRLMPALISTVWGPDYVNLVAFPEGAPPLLVTSVGPLRPIVLVDDSEKSRSGYILLG